MSNTCITYDNCHEYFSLFNRGRNKMVILDIYRMHGNERQVVVLDSYGVLSFSIVGEELVHLDTNTIKYIGEGSDVYFVTLSKDLVGGRINLSPKKSNIFRNNKI